MGRHFEKWRKIFLKIFEKIAKLSKNNQRWRHSSSQLTNGKSLLFGIHKTTKQKWFSNDYILLTNSLQGRQTKFPDLVFASLSWNKGSPSTTINIGNFSRSFANTKNQILVSEAGFWPQKRLFSVSSWETTKLAILSFLLFSKYCTSCGRYLDQYTLICAHIALYNLNGLQRPMVNVEKSQSTIQNQSCFMEG